jgi:hypothetical protein
VDNFVPEKPSTIDLTDPYTAELNVALNDLARVDRSEIRSAEIGLNSIMRGHEWRSGDNVFKKYERSVYTGGDFDKPLPPRVATDRFTVTETKRGIEPELPPRFDEVEIGDLLIIEEPKPKIDLKTRWDKRKSRNDTNPNRIEHPNGMVTLLKPQQLKSTETVVKQQPLVLDVRQLNKTTQQQRSVINEKSKMVPIVKMQQKPRSTNITVQWIVKRVTQRVEQRQRQLTVPRVSVLLNIKQMPISSVSSAQSPVVTTAVLPKQLSAQKPAQRVHQTVTTDQINIQRYTPPTRMIITPPPPPTTRFGGRNNKPSKKKSTRSNIILKNVTNINIKLPRAALFGDKYRVGNILPNDIVEKNYSDGKLIKTNKKKIKK